MVSRSGKIRVTIGNLVPMVQTTSTPARTTVLWNKEKYHDSSDIGCDPLLLVVVHGGGATPDPKMPWGGSCVGGGKSAFGIPIRYPFSRQGETPWQKYSGGSTVHRSSKSPRSQRVIPPSRVPQVVPLRRSSHPCLERRGAWWPAWRFSWRASAVPTVWSGNRAATRGGQRPSQRP